jgi:hypothetical protein
LRSLMRLKAHHSPNDKTMSSLSFAGSKSRRCLRALAISSLRRANCFGDNFLGLGFGGALRVARDFGLESHGSLNGCYVH